MTVNCITPDEKTQIIQMFGTKKYQQKELASTFFTSERTINRVLIEAGLLTPVAQLKADAYNALQLFKKYNLTLEQAETMLATQCTTHPSQFVEHYLSIASEEELGRLFWSASVANIKKEMLQQLKSPTKAKHQNKETVTDDLPF